MENDTGCGPHLVLSSAPELELGTEEVWKDDIVLILWPKDWCL